MHGGKRRRLGPEERALWEQVVASVSPMGKQAPRAETSIPPEPAARPHEHYVRAEEPRAPTAPVPPSNGSRISFSLAEPEVLPAGPGTPGLDRRMAARLRKGDRKPDARIDLHGMTAERAHSACLRFLADALGRGQRLVLVITGKGGQRRDETGIMRSGRGVLRESLPGWLRASPLGHAIVGIYQAAQRHGGDGAFYVYLKRQR